MTTQTLRIALTVTYALAVIAAGALLQSDGLVTAGNAAFGAFAIAGPVLYSRARRPHPRPQPAEPLPELGLAQLSERIGGLAIASAPAPDEGTPKFLRLIRPRFESTRANGSWCAIVVVGIDRWTRFDAPVAPAGALSLEGAAAAVRSHVRPQDLAAPYGDGKFILFLDRCGRAEAHRIVDRLAQRVFALRPESGRLSLSAGIACYPDAAGDVAALIASAEPTLRAVRTTGHSEIRFAPSLQATTA